jgi:hypothetical protein
MTSFSDFLKEERKPKGLVETQSGTKHSLKKKPLSVLKSLGYCSLKEAVGLSREIDAEIEYQKQLRAREIVELAPNGRERAFRAEILIGAYQVKLNTVKEILRYQYPVAKEEEETKGNLPPLVVVTTSGKERMRINDVEDAQFKEIDDTAP